tara:strand:- start:175 stop:441 length:267 start_codon:yes stop_codon:yes gene_type:complete
MNPLLKILVKQLIKGSKLKEGEIVAFTQLDEKIEVSILKNDIKTRTSLHEKSKNLEALFKTFKTNYFTIEITKTNLIIKPKNGKTITL